jgi:predicted neuraminidase
LTDHVKGEKSASLLVTDNNGETWRQVGAIDRGSQPTLIQRSDGSLLALLRSEPFILKTESRDLGETWTPTDRTELKCPGAGIAMYRLQNGHVVLVHNDSSSDRTPLSIRRSTDDGSTWSEPLHLECNPGEYSYPCVIQTSDGKIHITYTFRRYSIKHVEMNEDWLEHTDRPN